MSNFQQTLNENLYPICAAISLLALVYKLRVLSTDRSVVQVALVGNFFFLFATYTVSTPAVWSATSHAVGIVNFSGLFTQSCVIMQVACQQLVLLHLSHQRSVAWRKATPRLIAIGGILVAMVSLFSMAEGMGEESTQFAVAHAQYHPLYLSVYLLGYGANQLDMYYLGWKYAKVAPTPWLRRGLLMISLAVPFGLAYATCRIADIVAGLLGSNGQAWEPVAPIAVSISAVVRVIGWTLPDWGPYLSRLWQHIEHRRIYWELKPLHRATTAQAPALVLRLKPGTDLRTRLYRRVVEIRDAQWALRAWMDPAVAEHARRHAVAGGFCEADLAAFVEAAQLTSALRAKARGTRPPAHVTSPRMADPPDLAAELDFQRRLARAFRRPSSLPLTEDMTVPTSSQEST
ncbi:MAB_1171c family putative transporter [Streptomyces sp. 769]|uniref:MAB_1171c family putative transporter n=1 Tax=Streptomyces sp. 769 TaxID=1262452 RepID=UPI000581C875|nr:MAB_1171c family putative transporter [Streptomyces sp. 769]AJC62124.1 integral membrane protein [Streptomyces sp. 769]